MTNSGKPKSGEDKKTLGWQLLSKLDKLDDECPTPEEFYKKKSNLHESLSILYPFFFKMAQEEENTENKRLFDNAGYFCSAMSLEAAFSYYQKPSDPTTRISKEENLKHYADLDKALDLLFATQNRKPAYLLNSHLNVIHANPLKKVEEPNPSAIEQIRNDYAEYNDSKSESSTAIETGEDLIKGIKGLQTYINNDGLNKKQREENSALDAKLKQIVKLAKNEVILQKQQLDSIRETHLKKLGAAISDSRRLRKNSNEYGDMLTSAQNLSQKWAESNEVDRRDLLNKAKEAADVYITGKGPPITKEGKKRYALAHSLLKTVKNLLQEDLTNPKTDKENLINDDEINIIEINEDENENEIISTRSTSPTERRNDRIKERAQKKLDAYSRYYYNIAIGENAQYNVLAKAAAVNVLMQLGIKDNSKSEPSQIFSKDNINQVAATVKQTQWFKKNMNKLEQMVFKKENDVTMPMELQDIIKLNYSITDLKRNLGAKKPGSATTTSKQKQTPVNQLRTQTIRKTL